jgi:5-hydroxyisourate hydrolase
MKLITISTHVLHLGTGLPAAGVFIEVVVGDELLSGRTDADGRLSFEGLLPAGPCSMRFEVEEHSELYRAVTVDMDLSEPRHYHLPLLLSPYGITAYRGS